MYNHSDNAEKLNRLYCCTQAQSNMINAMISKTDDDNFKKDLSQHLHRFRALESELSRTLQKNNIPEHGISKFKAASDRMRAGLKLIGLSSPAQISAELKNYTNRKMSTLPVTQSCDTHVQQLSSKLNKTQQAFISCIGKYESQNSN